MGKLKSFFVNFNENKEVYLPGENVSGSVIADLSEPMKLRALRIEFRGKAHVHWTETYSDGKNTHTRHYRGEEDYFKHSVSVYGKESGGNFENSKELPSGESVFPFQFQLPMNLPSSFEGRHGYVRYYVKATIDKPWKFNHNTKRAFTVLDMIDLNENPNAKVPSTANGSKNLCCLCCASGPIQAEVQLDRTGYVPGEFFLINANVENGSNKDLAKTSAALVQQVKFKATSKSKRVSETVAEISGAGVRGRQSLQWSNERLQIPAIPPSMLRHCGIIIITYQLQFSVAVPGPRFNLKVNVPVEIGSVPLQGLTPYNMPAVAAAPTTFQSEAPPVASSSGLPPPEQPSAPAYEPPPPSYAAVYSGTTDIRDNDDNDHLMGERSFAPQYAYYDWSQSAFTYTNPSYK